MTKALDEGGLGFFGFVVAGWVGIIPLSIAAGQGDVAWWILPTYAGGWLFGSALIRAAVELAQRRELKRRELKHQELRKLWADWWRTYFGRDP